MASPLLTHPPADGQGASSPSSSVPKPGPEGNRGLNPTTKLAAAAVFLLASLTVHTLTVRFLSQSSFPVETDWGLSRLPVMD